MVRQVNTNCLKTLKGDTSIELNSVILNSFDSKFLKALANSQVI